MKTAMMSIREPYARAIMKGEKKYEYRTRKPAFGPRTRVMVYVPGRDGGLIGEMVVEKILSGTPESIWRRTAKEAGVDRDTFFAYFAGRTKAFALRILRFVEWEHPVRLDDLRKRMGAGFRPPQFFRWLGADEVLRVRPS